VMAPTAWMAPSLAVRRTGRSWAAEDGRRSPSTHEQQSVNIFFKKKETGVACCGKTILLGGGFFAIWKNAVL